MSQQTKSFQDVEFYTKMIEETLLSINDRCLPLAEARQLIFNGKAYRGLNIMCLVHILKFTLKTEDL